MDSVRRITYEEVVALNIPDKSLIFSPSAEYWAFWVSGYPVSVTAVSARKNGIKLQANYTFPEHRGKGYFNSLLSSIIKQYNDFDVYADCLKASVGIYIRAGFEVYKIKDFKNFTIYYSRLIRGEVNEQVPEKDGQSKDGAT